MTSAFRGWEAVANNLIRRSKKPDAGQWSLNEGQRHSLRAIAKRLPSNGVLIADEVGMGKTAVCAALILANRSTNTLALKTTLVITNTTLTQQWIDELKKFAPGLLSFSHYYKAL